MTPLNSADTTSLRVGRLDSLTGLRWWAAFGVFVFHMNNIAPLPIGGAFRLGNYGVTFFFVLSGFVLTWSARRAVGTSTFYVRRFARVYPAHLAALVLAIPVFYSFVPAAEDWWVKPIDVGVLALSVLLLQGWWRDPVILFSGNPAAWTLTCEAFFYALHPVLNRALGRWLVRGALIAAGGIVVVAVLLRVLVLADPAGLAAALPWPVYRLTEFAIGMCVARALSCGWRFRVPPAVFTAAAVGLAVVLVVPVTIGPVADLRVVVGLFSNEIVIVICALLIVAVAARDARHGSSLLRSRPLVWLGEVSYSFYLVHATVIYVALGAFGPEPSQWRNLIWYLAVGIVSILAAGALHYLVERPCERAIRRWWDRRAESRSPISKTA